MLRPWLCSLRPALSALDLLLFLFCKQLLYLLIYVFRLGEHIWMVADSLWESVLASHHMSSGNNSQVALFFISNLYKGENKYCTKP